jgi:uncharacterized protein (DUF362 family)
MGETKVFVKSIDNNIIDVIHEAFETFGGYSKLVKGKVFIKINLTMADPSAITSPEVVLNLIEYLKQKGKNTKDIYVFDNAAAGNPTRVVFRTSNLGKRIKKTGAHMLCLDETKPMQFNFEGKILKDPIPFSSMFYEYLIKNRNDNTYINCPKLKIHLQTGITCCIKNQHGLLYDEEKLYEHHHIDEKIVDIYQKIRPDFNLVDGTSCINHGVFAFKPEWIIKMNLILAGIDGVAVDTIGAKLLGIEDVKHIEIAGQRGLGCNKIEQIQVVPNPQIIDEKKVQLNDDFNKVPIEIPDNIKFISGKEWPGCKGGCRITMFYLQMLTSNQKTGPLVTAIGRGIDTAELDKYSGPFLVNGPCAVKELKEYFDKRQQNEKIKVVYIDKHFGIGDFVMKAIQTGKIPFAAAGQMIKIPISSMMIGYIGAKLRHAKFVGMI